jgi:hypothetical protein
VAEPWITLVFNVWRELCDNPIPFGAIVYPQAARVALATYKALLVVRSVVEDVEISVVPHAYPYLESVTSR